MNYVLFPTVSRLQDFYNGDRKKSLITLILFLSGIFVFVANNTILFWIKDERVYLIPRLIMRFFTSSVWFAAAVMGTLKNRTKRNLYLLPCLFCYIPGDIFAMISIKYVPFSAVFYAAGHIFFVIAIMETTYIKKYQYIAFFLGSLLAIGLMLWYFKGITVACCVGIIYGILCSFVMATSLSNRFFCVAGIIFFLSDVAGLARKALMNTKPVYLFTTFLYYFAIFLLCVSVFNESKKNVVTWKDLKQVLKLSEKSEAKLYLAGKWAMNFVLKKFSFFTEKIEFAYNLKEKEKLRDWLSRSKYEVISDSPDGVFQCYSEKYGPLYAIPFSLEENAGDGKSGDRKFEDGSVKLVTSSHKTLLLDPGFFTKTKFSKRQIDCLVPGIDLLN